MDVLTAIGQAALAGAAVGALATGLAFGIALGSFDLPLAVMVAFIAFLIGIPLATVHAVLLGLPLYLAVRRWWGQPGWVGSALFGLAIGLLPLAIPLALSSSSAGGVAAIDQSGQIVAIFGLAGIAASLVFRRLLGDEDAE